MKKIVSMILICLIALSALVFTGCPGNNNNKVNKQNKLVSITISFEENITEIEAGQDVKLNISTDPISASTTGLDFEFISGIDYAYITNLTLSTSQTVPNGTIIKLKAIIGTIKSNELIIKVVNQKEITKSQLNTQLSILQNQLQSANQNVTQTQYTLADYEKKRKDAVDKYEYYNWNPSWLTGEEIFWAINGGSVELLKAYEAVEKAKKDKEEIENEIRKIQAQILSLG